MIPLRVLIWRVTIALVLLLVVWVLLVGAADYEARQTRIQAKALLRDVAQLKIGKSRLDQVNLLVTEYHGKWRKTTTSGAGSPCGLGASVVDFYFDNHWLHWFLPVPLTDFGVNVYVKDNSVCYLSAQLVTIWGDNVCGLSAEEFSENPFSRPFSVSLNPVKTMISLGVGASTEERSAAFSFNMDCLTKLRGCLDTREMAPAIWRNSREVAPTYWKSQWDE